MIRVAFRIWRGDRRGGKCCNYSAEVTPGMVVLDAIVEIQRTQANDLAVRWNCKAGKCGSCSTEINSMPKLMCMTRFSMLLLNKPVMVEDHRFISLAALWGLLREGQIRPETVSQAIRELEINPEKLNPSTA